MIKPIKQPNSWTCYPSVCCMITGESMEEFFDFVGHKGDRLDPKSKHPLKATSFYDHEALQYLASRRFFSMVSTSKEISEHLDTKGYITIVYDPTNRDHYFMISVKSKRFEGCSHMILYYGGIVYDPSPESNGDEKLTDYEIQHIIPIIKI